MTHRWHCGPVWVAVAVCLGLLVPVCAAAEPEILYFRNGDRVSGESLRIVDGSLQWLTPFGQEFLVPLGQIDRLELPQAPFRPVSHSVPGSPPVSNDAGADQPVIVPLPEEPGAPKIVPDPPTELTDVLAAPEPAGAGPALKLFDEVLADPNPLPWIRSLPLYAETAESIRAWTKRVQLGGQFNDGNTDNNLFNVNIEFEKSDDKALRQFDIGGQYGQSNNETNVSRLWYNGNVDHKVYDKWIFFWTTKNEYNRFTNLDYRGIFSLGLGYRFINEGNKRLITRLGPAVTAEIFQNDPFRRVTPDLHGEIEARWPFFERVQFEQKSRVNPTMTNLEIVRVVSTSSLVLDLDEDNRWKLRFSLRYEYNSQPAAGRLSSDYLSTMSLMYVRR